MIEASWNPEPLIKWLKEEIERLKAELARWQRPCEDVDDVIYHKTQVCVEALARRLAAQLRSETEARNALEGDRTELQAKVGHLEQQLAAKSPEQAVVSAPVAWQDINNPGVIILRDPMDSTYWRPLYTAEPSKRVEMVEQVSNGERRFVPKASPEQAAPVVSVQREPTDFLLLLRRMNKERCENNFKHAITSWNVMEWGCALAGEAGELCNVLKKVKREQDGIAGSRVDGDKTKAIADEIADVVIYADLLAELCGIDLADAIAGKFNETSKKVGYTKMLAAAPAPSVNKAQVRQIAVKHHGSVWQEEALIEVLALAGIQVAK